MSKKKWILLVDDDPAVLTILEDTLTHKDLNITTAKDAMQAFIQARELSPIIIISDMQMPGYLGSKTLELLRADPTLPRVPIIFMTGMDLNKARELLPANDPTVGLLQKPLDFAMIRDYVWKLAGVAAPVDPETKPK